MEKRDLKVGEVVQINPDYDPRFGGCLMVVTEPKAFGAMGYVNVPDTPAAKQAYYRCAFENMESLNVTAEWSVE